MNPFNTAVFTLIFMACAYVGMGLLVDAATSGNIGACVLSALALATTWLGVRITWQQHMWDRNVQ